MIDESNHLDISRPGLELLGVHTYNPTCVDLFFCFVLFSKCQNIVFPSLFCAELTSSTTSLPTTTHTTRVRTSVHSRDSSPRWKEHFARLSGKWGDQDAASSATGLTLQGCLDHFNLLIHILLNGCINVCKFTTKSLTHFMEESLCLTETPFNAAQRNTLDL